ncbi:MAG: pantoate--beta-alanine ligase [Candidatus Aegiribacteria sp.]|nr:pantoate--beta-alanine ligase [Candidatus Aegiribacteria sp.]
MSAVPVLRTIEEVRKTVDEWRCSGRTIGFVPTMGALHQGHLSLVSKALDHADSVIVSIFVNPAQFGQDEDFESYPRTISDDIDKLEKAGVNAVFYPEKDIIYPEGSSTSVHVSNLTETLCGKQRPGHFDGVATVCAILFGIVKPDIAVFGRKDAQQLAVIKRMVQDLRFDIRIVGADIYREHDGLAVSSRNRYLRPIERTQATALFRGLSRAAELAGKGERDTGRLCEVARQIIKKSPLAVVQYLEIVDQDTMKPVERLDGPGLLAVAVYFGKTRLIDNIVLNPGANCKED